MSMTPQNSEALDTAGLRAKAEAATAGPWSERRITDDECSLMGYEIIAADGTEISSDCEAPNNNDALYIAAANPSVICALLDERDDLLNSIDRAERTLRMHGFQDTGKPEWERAEAAFNPDWANYRQGLGDGRAEAAAGAVPKGFALVSKEKLRELYLWIDPPAMEVNGGTAKFVNPNAAECLHQLSNRVRGLFAAPPAQDAGTGDAKDAERYRWLRGRSNAAYFRAPMVFMCDNGDELTWSDARTGEDLDAALDIAIERLRAIAGRTA